MSPSSVFGSPITSSGLTNSQSTAAAQITAVTSCHFHGTAQLCIAGNSAEGTIIPAPTNTETAPTQYTGCHSHGQNTFCMMSDGEEVQFLVAAVPGSGDSSTAATITTTKVSSLEATETSSASSSTTTSARNCHFHAGVEHCVRGSAEESEATCERISRDYNIPLRIGLIFPILVASAIGVYGPLVAARFFKISMDGIIFTIIKQFGTGIIISTALVHLSTHAALMWGNSCLGELGYESISTAITMAGLFLSFTIEYLGNRLLKWRQSKIVNGENDETHDHEKGKSGANESLSNNINDDASSDLKETLVSNSSPHSHENGHGHVHDKHLINANDKLSVMVMEAGIVFHSILIGITLVVAGDTSFITLFIVIIFHQMFEGLALGSRIASLTKTSTLTKFFMGGVFSCITPIGMAIGIGVLSKFNGNDKSTIIALGTLDSLSAGILLWTGVVEMWAHDWLFGNLVNSGALKTVAAFVSLMGGMVLMSVLGKWA
ncbi:high-affinity zinc transport protein [Nadsonia fulvescens var. elongata DSM 6958]|uniref:High-affinity zinc transport protein n=1 Tax=Nadsonia fulvescens var. elongata DSM 6958 TaxID=857566 RepID=A0A1E3PNI6_9ASCO|nr:high-affinity zinc transport protein [Nadsonia fulvescens var. elongata DSM 6958]